MAKKKKSQYEGILIRASLSDTGALPRTGTVSCSPDVIPFGEQAASNPSKVFITNWDKDLGVALTAEKQNFVYVRGIETSCTDFIQKDCYVFYSKDSEIDDPQNWIGNQLATQSGAQKVLLTAQNESKVVTTDPFIWTPPNPTDGETYSLIAVLVDEGDFPSFDGVNGDWETYVDNNGNVGWNKVTIKAVVPPPTPPLRWSTTFDYSQVTTQTVSFTLLATNIPKGSALSLSSVADDDSTGTPSVPIKINSTRVSTSPSFTVGIDSKVPDGYKAKITFNLYADSPPEGSNVQFTASYIPSNEQGGSGPVHPVLIEAVTTTN